MKGKLAWRRWEHSFPPHATVLERCVPAGEHQKFQAGLNLLEKQPETEANSKCSHLLQKWLLGNRQQKNRDINNTPGGVTGLYLRPLVDGIRKWECRDSQGNPEVPSRAGKMGREERGTRNPSTSQKSDFESKWTCQQSCNYCSINSESFLLRDDLSEVQWQGGHFEVQKKFTK